MPTAHHRHAKVAFPTIKDYLKRREENNHSLDPVNAQAHDQLHGPKHMIYTGHASIVVETGCPFYFIRGGTITNITANIKTAGSADVTADLLLDGTAATDTPITIVAGEVQARYRIVTRPDFDETTKFEVDITANGTDAVGPLIVVIEYLPEF